MTPTETLETATRCFHGGAFFSAIGEEFDSLENASQIINADVLDAWYPPAPNVIQSLQEHLPWLIRTSPPTHCEGLLRTIARCRGVSTANLLPGAGSSDLIFRVFRQWLTPHSRVLILDPMYGEYSFILESVIGCRVVRMPLLENDQFRIPLHKLIEKSQDSIDLVVIVNPNSPTGQHVQRETLQAALREIPKATRVWIDETYIDYAGPDESLERFAATSPNVVVCKSMSKVYALSGMRVAYLCGGRHHIELLRWHTPPWVIGLPAQVAAVEGLKNPDYYQQRIRETHELRDELAVELQKLNFYAVPGVANFLLCRLPPDAESAEQLINSCRQHGLFLRNPTLTDVMDKDGWIRIAVKDAQTNARMREIIGRGLFEPAAAFH